MNLEKKYKLFTDLQDAWEDTDKIRRGKFDCDLERALTMKFFKQYLKNKEAKWKYCMEEMYMNEMKLQYNNNLDNVDRF